MNRVKHIISHINTNKNNHALQRVDCVVNEGAVESSNEYGGYLIAKVLLSEGVESIFTLTGGHISPMLVGCNKLGIKVISETLRRSLKSQMREANKVNAQFVVIIGQEGVSEGEVLIKNMSDGSQTNASIETIEDYFGVDYEYK